MPHVSANYYADQITDQLNPLNICSSRLLLFSKRVRADFQSDHRYPRGGKGLDTSFSQKERMQANIEAAKLEVY